jgi:hypothetical protein
MVVHKIRNLMAHLLARFDIIWSTTIILPYQRQLKLPFSWWEIGVE